MTYDIWHDNMMADHYLSLSSMLDPFIKGALPKWLNESHLMVATEILQLPSNTIQCFVLHFNLQSLHSPTTSVTTQSV